MATDTVSRPPVVSVIVPARNEEVCLGPCLHSLLIQNFAEQSPAFEIIVVDDHSSDRTREIALSFPEVRVIDAGPLPAGWTGKNNAVTAGANLARGEWLLFTDADTVHLPGSLARSLKEARVHGADLLSYSPQQTVETVWEKAVMPVIFAELAASYRPSQVSAPNSSAAAANGQFLLITRAAYEAVGGHAAIAANLLEDVALARAVKRSGHKIFFRFGGDAVRTRMYRSFAQLREGWTKNLALLFPTPVRLAAVRALEWVLIVASFTISINGSLHRSWLSAVLAAMLTLFLYALFLRRIGRAHFSWDANLFALFGLPLFSYLLLRSEISHRRGRISWKGRQYPGNQRPGNLRPRNRAAVEPAGEFDSSTQEKHGLSHAQG